MKARIDLMRQERDIIAARTVAGGYRGGQRREVARRQLITRLPDIEGRARVRTTAVSGRRSIR